MLIIRKTIAEDLPFFPQLCKLHADFEKLSFHFTDQHFSRWTNLIFLQSKLFVWVCADKANIPQGYLSATIDYATWSAEPFIYLDCLFIKEEFRRYGLGRQFISILTDFARSNHISRIEWQTPLSNEGAIHFYEAIGAHFLAKARFSLTV